jgi:tetratricopeptide (TPR) repeat protein
MNRLVLLYRLLGSYPLVLLLAGCLGGSVQPVRPDTLLRAETALNRGLRAQEQGDAITAERFLTQALALSSSVEDYPLKTTALINLARLYRLQHDLSKAGICIDQALAAAADDPRLSAEAAYEKALLELAKDDPSTALEWVQKSITAQQGSALGRSLNLAARIQIVRGRWSEAEALAGKALYENRSAGEFEEQANSLRILGIVARDQKNYAAAGMFLREALQIDKRIGKSGKIAADLEELAATARSAGNLKDSASYLERAYELHQAGGRFRQAGQNQEALAGVYAALGEELKANSARETARKLSIRDGAQQPGSSSTTTNPSSRP